jgi:hypothetical protein
MISGGRSKQITSHNLNHKLEEEGERGEEEEEGGKLNLYKDKDGEVDETNSRQSIYRLPVVVRRPVVVFLKRLFLMQTPSRQRPRAPESLQGDPLEAFSGSRQLPLPSQRGMVRQGLVGWTAHLIPPGR